MKNNFKLVLLEYRKKLSPEQDDIDRILFEHYSICDEFSEIESVSILDKQLERFVFHNEVKQLMEALNTELVGEELTYELKDLYHRVNRVNQGKVYNYPLNLLVNIINTPDEYDRLNKIVNELKNYEWIPEIKLFMHKFQSSPMERANFDNDMGGRASKTYSYVEKVDEGQIAWVGDRWFHFSKDGVAVTGLDEFFSGEKLASLNRISEAMLISEITDKRIDFQIDEDLVLGISVDKKGRIFINESETESETTLESLFNSPVIPFLKGGFYPVILEAINGIDKFMDLDICTKITNITNPFKEVYAINWKGDAYAYVRDSRYGTTFHTYESVLDLVNEISREMSFDLTYFYPEKISEEIINKKDLEDKEQIINLELQEVKEALSTIDENSLLMTYNPQLKDAYEDLQVVKLQLEDKLKEIKKEKIKLSHRN